MEGRRAAAFVPRGWRRKGQELSNSAEIVQQLQRSLSRALERPHGKRIRICRRLRTVHDGQVGSDVYVLLQDNSESVGATES